MCGEEAQERCAYGEDWRRYVWPIASQSSVMSDCYTHHALCSSVHKQARKLRFSIGTIPEFSGGRVVPLSRLFSQWKGDTPSPHPTLSIVALQPLASVKIYSWLRRWYRNISRTKFSL